MRDYVEQESVITKQVETSCYCNKCSKLSKRSEMDSSHKNINLEFGYESKHDSEIWNFDLCEECLIEFIKTFNIVPDGFYQDKTYYPLEKNHQKSFEIWKKTNEWESFVDYTYDELVGLQGLFLDTYINELITKYYPDHAIL